MDRYVYLSVLQDDLRKMLKHYEGKYSLTEKKWIFMQDNDPKHTSKVVKEWLKDQNFGIMEWPAQSPDLNPIENMWSLLKTRLFKNYEHPPAGMNVLWERSSKTWYSIDIDECQKYIETMPKRCQQVIKNNGLYTNY